MKKLLVLLGALGLVGGVAFAQVKGGDTIQYNFDQGSLVKTVTTTEVVDPTDVNQQIYKLAGQIKDYRTQIATITAELDAAQAKQDDLIAQRQAIINSLPKDQQDQFPTATTTIP